MTEPETLSCGVDYRRLAIRQQTIRTTLAPSRLPRTAAVAEGGVGMSAGIPTIIELAFFEDRQRRVRVTGRLRTTLRLRCQRCLTAFARLLDVTVAGVVVSDDAAAADVPRADEPMLAENGRLDVAAMVDDELLLALPAIARCQRMVCTARYQQPDRQNAEPGRHNPFAMLQSLKDK